MLVSSERRECHRKVHQLFLASGIELLSFLATNITISETIIAPVNENCGTPCYATGTLSHLLIRAFDRWPQEVMELFSRSETTFPLIIKNLDRPIVFQTISKFTTHNTVLELLWHIWIVMSGKDKLDRKDRPRRVWLVKDYDHETLAALRARFSMAHKVNAIELLKMFFSNNCMEENNSFAILIFMWIISLGDAEFVPGLYELTDVITTNYAIQNEITQQVVNKVLNADLEKGQIAVVCALHYLTRARKHISEEDKQKLVTKVHYSDHYSQYAMVEASEFMNEPH